MPDLGIMCISITNNPEYANKKFDIGKSSIQIISEGIKKNFPEAKVVNYLRESIPDTEDYEKLFDNNVKIVPDIYSLLLKAKEDFKDTDNLLVIHTDEPLIDFTMVPEMIELHVNEIADYTMTENYPAGIGISVISFDTLSRLLLITSGNNELYTKESIFKIIDLNINSYDIEVKVCLNDMRRDRLELFANNKRNFLTCNNILNQINSTAISFDDVYKVIKNKPELIRTTPAYIEIEISGSYNKNDITLPGGQTGRDNTFMSFEDYKKIIDDIDDNCEEAVVCLSFRTEPFKHPDIMDFIKYTISKNQIRIIVETSGVLLDKSKSDELFEMYNDKLHLIFNISATDEEMYEKITGLNAFKEAEKNIDYYISKQSNNTFLQYTKMAINEDYIDDFYSRWKKYEERIIISKYNDYRGELKKDETHDLSPINRFPCWRLKRDMYINSNCDAVRCIQDYKGEFVLGNVLSDGILSCFQKGEDFYIKDYINGPSDYCENCHEYFIYNF